MATAQKEIPIDDAELDDLMAQLEAETADVVDAPSAQPAKLSDDELEAALAAAGDPDLKEIVAAVDETEQLLASAANAAHIAKSLAQAKTKAAAPADEPELIELEDDAPFAPTAPVLITGDGDALPTPDDELAALTAELQAEEAKPAATKEDTLEADLAAIAAKMPAAAPKSVAVKEPEPIEHLEGEAALSEALAATEHDMTHYDKPAARPAPRPTASKSFLIDPAEFKRETRISMTDLDNCMIEQSSLRAYYGTLSADAEAEAAKLKLRHDIVEARVFDRHRKELAKGSEKVTEKMVENAVKQDPEWAQSKLRVIESEQAANRNRACVDSLKDRKDMLVQLGADRREEGKGQTRILAVQEQHMDKRAQVKAMQEEAARRQNNA